MTGDRDTTSAQAVDGLVDEYRQRCLWFLCEEYYPQTDAERLKVLDYIRRHGDREEFQRAGGARRWFSLHSSERSAVSQEGVGRSWRMDFGVP